MIELIGFIISLLALFYLFIAPSTPIRRLPSVDEEEEEIEDPIREWIREPEKKEKVRSLPPSTLPSLKKEQTTQKKVLKKPVSSSLEGYQILSQVEKRKLKSSLEDRYLLSHLHEREQVGTITPYQIEQKKTISPSRAKQVVLHLPHPSEAIIYQEIINRPRALRPYE